MKQIGFFIVFVAGVPAAAAPHWAFQPIVRPPIPAVKGAAWVRSPIDTFILLRLEDAAITPAAEASRESLIRRVTFDLIGLPPDPADVDAFLCDESPDAWARVIDRLLASPHHGERWGRHWLDLARFADSNGFEHDEIRPDAWRYRDYVIRSYNADKPYDRFVHEQISGDELVGDDRAGGGADALIATGFNLLGPDMTDASEQAQRRQNTLNDMTDTAGLVFLGMTIGCARCHDHKFEPIPQADYYRLQAFFTPAVFRRDLVIAESRERARHEAALKEHAALVKPHEDEIAKLEEPYRARLREAKLLKIADEAQAAHRKPEAQRTPSERELVEKTERLVAVAPDEVLRALSEGDRTRRKILAAEASRFDARRPAALPLAMGLSNPAGDPARTFLLERGELCNPAEEVQPGPPSALAGGSEASRTAVSPARGRRSILAKWITSRENPAAARVIVNRVWQHHFGRGIVPTPSDFGLRGEPPTHPELLDWLAAELMARGWSLKALHKLILMSAAYAQASAAAPAAAGADPDNKLFSRQSRVRLEGEAVRDALLAASGRWSRKMGGPGVFPPVPEDALKGTTGWKTSSSMEDHVRRSIYIFARRNLRFPFLEAFDYPDSNMSCPSREMSTTAPQALALLGASDVVEAAEALAKRVEKEAAALDERIALAYRLALGRSPMPGELELARAFLETGRSSELCRALFNLNEFVYVD